jgi:hypothetical protein
MDSGRSSDSEQLTWQEWEGECLALLAAIRGPRLADCLPGPFAPADLNRPSKEEIEEMTAYVKERGLSRPACSR